MLTSSHWVALAGGVGGAKLAAGLAQVAGPDLSIVVNTGDDFDYLGLRICPDLDSNLYSLSGRNDPVRGWGRCDESWQFMSALAELLPETWFQLGDRDLAVHVYRTARLREGKTLSEVTADLARRLGIVARLVPMTDESVRTLVETATGTLEFQDYFVRQRSAPVVTGFRYAGATSARPPESVRDLWAEAPAAAILCPSNPYVSIGPILAVPAWSEWLRRGSFPVVAVSPLVGGQALKGPAAKMLGELGHAVSPLALLDIYDNLLDGIVIDSVDLATAADIERRGVRCLVTDIVMRTAQDQAALARQVIAFAGSLGTARRAR